MNKDELLDSRNQFVPADRVSDFDSVTRQRLGVVVGGSLNEDILVKLDTKTFVEGLAVGGYVTIDGQSGRKFFGLLNDIALDSVDKDVQRQPPTIVSDDDFVARVFRGTAVYGLLHVKPMLVTDPGTDEVRPVKTVPSHFAVAYRSTPEEVGKIFGQSKDNEGKPYTIGTSLDDDTVKINLDLERLLERSSAVFGRSGTGKTFLTLPLLASVIKQEAASALIFDMHNDYGQTLKADKNRKLHGLKRLPAIQDRVIVVSMDEDSSRQRKSSYEFGLKIGYDQIEPEDLEMLKQVLSLSDVQVNALFTLKHRFPGDWLKKLMTDEPDDDIQQLLDGNKLTDSTYYAMQRKLGRLLNKMEFLREQSADNFVERVLGHLTRGDSVVVEFGKYGNDMAAYVFVANFLTRRIHERYVKMKEQAEGGQGTEPQRLVIVIEEAHKFLAPEVAEFTIFGVIARELRKYNVTLLIVDQRPSQIAAEVMSQIGTRITCALSDERDIAAVFMGVSGGAQMRSVLAALDSKQQALIMGHAVPMPVVVRTSEYGEGSYAAYEIALGGRTSAERQERSRAALRGKTDLRSDEPFG